MKRVVAIGVAAVAAVFGLLVVLRRPSNDRKWAPDQERLAHADIREPLVTIHDIRNFTYRSTTDYTPGYYDKTFDLRKLDSLWFVVEPFGRGGAAHTFVSFGFGDQDFVGISIEIRKEVGESFSVIGGMLRNYEVMYVVGDERDLIGLRANHRRDEVYLYRIRATPEAMRAMFLAMLQRANALREKPEFYNTLTNTCTTNLYDHVNEIVPGRIPFHTAVLLPAGADRFAHDLGLLDTNVPFAETKRAARINDLAARWDGDAAFSRRIRGLR
ncbi:MAG TPA: DUF4105 domain-containing protein [Thermoanaerobaculia bacterium]|nr:DUF4105 domain-containing protein [Thermoanaerobaculia bacterium]